MVMKKKQFNDKQIQTFLVNIDKGMLEHLETRGDWVTVEKIKKWAKIAKYQKPTCGDIDIDKFLILVKKGILKKMVDIDDGELLMESLIEEIKEIDEGKHFRNLICCNDAIEAYNERTEIQRLLCEVVSATAEEIGGRDTMECVKLELADRGFVEELSRWDGKENRATLASMLGLGDVISRSKNEILTELERFI